METAFLLQHVNGPRELLQVVALVDGVEDAFDLPVGSSLPWRLSACRRLRAAGRMHSADLQRDFPDLEVAEGLGVRGFVSIPVRLAGGATYGSLCALSSRPVNLVADRLAAADVLARIVASQAEREASAVRAAAPDLAAHNLRRSLALVEGWGELLGQHWDVLPPDVRQQAAATVERSARDLAVEVEALLARLAAHEPGAA